MKILICGIGNPGRQDDAIGPDFVDTMQRILARPPERPGGDSARSGNPTNAHEFSFDANYQLNVEDAEAVSRHDITIFVDASHRAEDAGTNAQAIAPADGQPFRLTVVDPEPTISFSTHSVSPGGIVALCSQLYDVHPAVYMLAIRGYRWEVNLPMSEDARANLEAAVRFLAGSLLPGEADRGTTNIREVLNLSLS